MKRFEVTIRIGKKAVQTVIVKTANVFKIKETVQKHNVKLIGVKPL